MESQYPKHIKNLSYGPSDLQSLDVCLPRSPEDSHSIPDHAVWIIYIHGGAWRDPTITSSSFEPALNLLLNSRKLKHIAGFASINYRLSPYPNHSTNPSSPSDPSRNVQHPAHVEDIVAAMRWLDKKYHVQSWICVGHSCGATMAFQLLKMGQGVWLSEDDDDPLFYGQGPRKPAAIVGLAGLYDLPALARNHADEPAYAEFLTAAFGPDQSVWQAESPNVGYMEELRWSNGHVVVLGQSPEDELVEAEQTENFAAAALKLPMRKWNGKNDNHFKVLQLEGKHNEIWSKGKGVAHAVEVATELLFETD